MRYSYLLLMLFAATLLSNCNKPGCLESAGPVQKTARTVSPFHRIDLYDNINLILTQDTLESVRVEAQVQIQPNISTIVTDGILTIKNNTTCNWLRNPSEKINVYVSVKNLDYVNYYSSGNVTSTNTLSGDHITFYSDRGAGNVTVRLNVKRVDAIVEYESADFTLSGRADYCYTYTNARGSINLENLNVQYMVIGYASVRNTTINVSDVIEATIFHTGNIYYKGRPTILANNHFSSGRLYPAP